MLTTTKEDLVSGAVEEIDALAEEGDQPQQVPPDYEELYEESLKRYARDHEASKEELERANKRITELSAMLYQVLNQMDDDLFSDQLSTTQRQNLIRLVKQRVPLTSEILDLVNKSKEQVTREQ